MAHGFIFKLTIVPLQSYILAVKEGHSATHMPFPSVRNAAFRRDVVAVCKHFKDPYHEHHTLLQTDVIYEGEDVWGLWHELLKATHLENDPKCYNKPVVGSMRGRKQSEQHKAKLAESRRGKTRSATTKAKMSAAHKERWVDKGESYIRSEEATAKMAESQRRVWAQARENGTAQARIAKMMAARHGTTPDKYLKG